MIAKNMKSSRRARRGFCLECNSTLILTHGGLKYACLCGCESASSYYLPFSWIFENSVPAEIPVAFIDPRLTRPLKVFSANA